MSKKSEMSIKEQLAQLDALIAWFDQADFDLDEALAKFDQGMQLADAIKQRLSSVEAKITILKQKFDQPEAQ